MSAAAGLIPYAPNTPLWSDGAAKTRFVSVPNSGAPYTADEQIGFASTGSWSFPAGTVFVKTFQLQTNQSDPNSLLRLETRLLVRDTNGAVYGVTYKWRPDYSDADLLTTSSNQDIAITTPSGITTQTWYYPSPADCLTCHTPQANYVLGVNCRQLNGNMSYPNGVMDNQLRALNRAGIFHPAFDETAITNFPQLSSLTNSLVSFEQRARSYLDANCAQCHQPGGSGPTIDALYDTPLTNQNLIYGVLTKGDLGYDNAYVVVPKDPWRSVLWDRMNTFD
jgi:mono/diheme cytochrome c family protein